LERPVATKRHEPVFDICHWGVGDLFRYWTGARTVGSMRPCALRRKAGM